MGNFEKLGILVIIVLVVVIIVVAAVGMEDPPARTDPSLAATSTAGLGGDGEDGEEPSDAQTPRGGGSGSPGGAGHVEPPPPVPPTPPTPREPRKYTVKSGDRLWTIAQKMYGSTKGHLWREIAKANPGVGERSLRPGTVLIIPELEAPRRGSQRDTPAVADGRRRYKIKPRDALQKIARHQLGRASRWQEIVVLNPGLDPRALPIGKEIYLPAR